MLIFNPIPGKSKGYEWIRKLHLSLSAMAAFVVSALKYRPLRFDEVVGQEAITHTLKSALKNDQLAHAFLFCGPRGVGKTTCARILAKAVNCQNRGDDFEPCNNCDSCRAFNQNASFNIIELDAASHNSVDHIRTLNDQVRVPPQSGDYKVFIIDEVHMLSSAAFNAFLKTLEEPPPYAKFILATTEKHKILPTILSRCQVFDFTRINTGKMVDHLASIAEKEGIRAEKEALHTIAQKSDGALRDALSIFDRIVSFTKDSLTLDDVFSNLNLLDYDSFFTATDALLEGDMNAIMVQFDGILRRGFEGEQFIIELAQHIRDLMVCSDPATAELLETTDKLRQRYMEQSRRMERLWALKALGLLNECDLQYGMSQNKRLHVEICLCRLAALANRKESQKKNFETSGSAELKPKAKQQAIKTGTPPAENTQKSEQSNQTTEIKEKKGAC